MHSLGAITTACHQAIAGEAEGRNWQYAYAQTVDPESGCDRFTVADGQESLPSTAALQARAKMIRDRSGYLRTASGDKKKLVRDDLMAQANQLLALAGL